MEDQIVFQRILRITRTTEDERILGECEELFEGGYSWGKELQGSKLKGFLKQKRISGHLVITRASRNDCTDGKCM